MDNGRAMLEAWWRDPADYAWLSRALNSHVAMRWTKAVIGAGGVFLASITLMVLSSDTGPISPLGRFLDWIITGFALFWAVRWWTLPWPTRTESLLLFAAADVAITVANLQESNRVYGAIGVILLVVTGGYIAVMHNAKVLALHASWTVLSSVALTARMVVAGGDLFLGIAIVLISLVAGVVMLPSMQFFYWVLRQDAVTDPLTKLLNRRGLELHLMKVVETGWHGPVCAIAVDLDRFKDVNDGFGHRVGDEVLTRTARRLRSVEASGMVVSRTGGEEFLIFGRLDAQTARTAAELIRRAVAEPEGPVAVTASIGVALFDGRCDSPTPYSLISCADTAMYRAKQLGGNLVVVQQLSARTPPVVEPRTPPVEPRTHHEGQRSHIP